MNFKDFGLREWLVIIFIILGLAAFVFDDYFKLKAYKKKDKTIRVTEIEVEHGDTDEIGGVALQKLVDDIKAKQRFDDIDMVAGATFSSEGFKEALDIAIDDIRNQE